MRAIAQTMQLLVAKDFSNPSILTIAYPRTKQSNLDKRPILLSSTAVLRGILKKKQPLRDTPF